jgi:hypothetical protein
MVDVERNVARVEISQVANHSLRLFLFLQTVVTQGDFEERLEARAHNPFKASTLHPKAGYDMIDRLLDVLLRNILEID